MGAPVGEGFSLVRGGPLHALLVRVRLVRGGRGDLRRVVLAAIATTWAPVVLLGAFGGAADLVDAPALHVRLLLTLPCILVAEAALHLLTRRCVVRFVEGDWAPGQRDAIARLLAGIVRARDAAIAEALLLVLAFALGLRTASLLRVGAGGVSAATVWWALVSLPAFQFLSLRWLWRWALWSVLLLRLARLDVRPIATHPDERGGLGLLAEPSVAYTIVAFGVGAMLAAERFGPRLGAADLERAAWGACVLAVISVALAFGPLLCFVPHLARARRQALRHFGNFATDYVRAFDERWIARRSTAGLLGAPDIQSLADLANAYGVVRRMRLVPVTRRQFAAVAGAAFVPLLLLVLAHVPLTELLGELGASWFGRLR